MRGFAVGLALALLLCGAWIARARGVAMRAATNENAYAALEDSSSAYRLRLIELSLASRQAPRSDPFLDHPHGAAVPFPPLLHASVATIASFAENGTGGPELANVGEDALEDLVRNVGPLLGVLATLLACAVAALITQGTRRAWAALSAAALYACLPTAVAREAADSLHAQPWIAVLTLGQIAALAFALRARQQIDASLGAFLAGLCCALSLLVGPEAWPVGIAILAVLVARAWVPPRPASRDAWRAATLFMLVAVAVVVIAEPGATIARFAPEFDTTRSAHGLLQRDWTTLAIAFAAFPAVWAALFARRRDPLHAMLLAAGFLSFACSLFDARFLATWHVVFALSLAIVVAQPPFEQRRSIQRIACAALAFALLAPAAFAHRESARMRATVEANRAELARGLTWMRANAPSPGPFNNVSGTQDWCVLAAPALAGSVAYFARKPVFASSIDGASSPNCARVPGLSFMDDPLVAARDARALGALFIIAGPRMRGDRQAATTFAGLFDLRPARSEVVEREAALREREQVKLDKLAAAGLERVYVSPRIVTEDGREPGADEAGGPLLSIWRLLPSIVDHEARLNPAGR